MKAKWNKLFITVVSMLLVVCTSFCLSACFGNDNNNQNTTPKEYTIQYTDGDSNKKITVTQGEPYALDVIPNKVGYEFQGLFDAQIGGTQYISKTGESLSPYNEGKSIVLYSQWKAKEYTVILDYQGGSVTGSRQLMVTYDSSLPELPKNSIKEHSNFTGWYTEPNCEGLQVADLYGLLPLVSKLTAENFDISTEVIYLYAGFELEKYSVTCYFEDGMNPEIVQIAYGTPANQIVTKTRVNNNGVLSWSKFSSKTPIFSGSITEDTVLWAVDYAPVIDFDVDGGKEVISLIAHSGSAITLPVTTKNNYKFMGWQDTAGNKVTYTMMPSDSTTLKAIWQPMIIFDSNNGSAVDNLSAAAGTTITLPTPTRNGFIFAGWYTTDKEEYTDTTMPSASLKLKAGWYKELTDTVVLIASDSYNRAYVKQPSTSKLCYRLDLSKYSNTQFHIDWHVKLNVTVNGSYMSWVNFYSKKETSSAYLIMQKSFDNIVKDTYKTFEFTTNFTNPEIYVCWFTPDLSETWWYMGITDYYYTVCYADIQNLYL